MKKQILRILILVLFISVSLAEVLSNYNDLKIYLDEKEKLYEEITNQYGLMSKLCRSS